MKKVVIIALLIGFVGALAAQAGQQDMPADKGQKRATGQDSGKPSTMTGCVAQSGAVYRLDHAVVGSDPDVDTQNRPATEASATPKMMSYVLEGVDLKAHLGHKVEVTATISSAKPANEAEIKGAPGVKLVGTLNVKSVKMVSTTCP